MLLRSFDCIHNLTASECLIPVLFFLVDSIKAFMAVVIGPSAALRVGFSPFGFSTFLPLAGLILGFKVGFTTVGASASLSGTSGTCCWDCNCSSSRLAASCCRFFIGWGNFSGVSPTSKVNPWKEEELGATPPSVHVSQTAVYFSLLLGKSWMNELVAVLALLEGGGSRTCHIASVLSWFPAISWHENEITSWLVPSSKLGRPCHRKHWPQCPAYPCTLQWELPPSKCQFQKHMSRYPLAWLWKIEGSKLQSSLVYLVDRPQASISVNASSLLLMLIESRCVESWSGSGSLVYTVRNMATQLHETAKLEVSMPQRGDSLHHEAPSARQKVNILNVGRISVLASSTRSVSSTALESWDHEAANSEMYWKFDTGYI